jgi:hypothetical protein
MRRLTILWGGLGAVFLAGAIGAGWILSLPPAPSAYEPPPLASGEAETILDGLKPRSRERPVVAIVGINNATEVTDYLMPTACCAGQMWPTLYCSQRKPGA